MSRKAHEVEPKTHVGKVIGALRGEEDLRLCGAGQSTLHQWLWLLQPPGLVQEDGILEVEDWVKLVVVVEQLSHRQMYGLVGEEEIALEIGSLPV